MPRARRRPVPRRALLAASLGALYGMLILPVPGPLTYGIVNFGGITWFFLALGVLFVTPVAFHAYSAWGILWIIYRGVFYIAAGAPLLILIDAAIPAASLWLLMTSEYLDEARARRQALRGG